MAIADSTLELEDLFAQVVDEFTDRRHRGEHVTIEEYASRYPALAADLRAVLGMLPAIRPSEDVDPSTVSRTRERTLNVSARLPQLTGFEVRHELGRGGMGVVYLATQANLNRAVALKMVLSGAHATSEERQRFLNEAGVLAKFQHPHIVQVHEFGTDAEQRPYFALEYLSGGSLAEKLRDGPLPARPAATLLLALAQAVGYAHAQGVIHRDLKPANVLFAADGTAKVTDFGLAKRTDSAAGFTATDAVIGTPSYMPPEQAGGLNADVGPAADVYSLGAILYECLTGRPPFRGASIFDTLAQVRSREPIAVRELQPSVPRDLETICLTCLQKDPGKRFASAEALTDDLQRFLDGTPIRSRPIGVWEKSRRWCRRNKGAAVLAGTALTLLMLVAAGSAGAAVWYRATLKKVEQAEGEARTSAKDADDARIVAEANASRAALAEADAQSKLRRGLQAEAEALRNGGRMGRRVESLAALRSAVDILRVRGGKAEDYAPLRHSVIASLALQDVRLGPTIEFDLAESDDREEPLAFDPAYRVAAAADRNRGVRFFDVGTGKALGRIDLVPASISGWVPRRFSPDGKLLAVATAAHSFTFYSVPDGAKRFAIRGPQRSRHFSFDTTSSRVFTPSGDGFIRAYNLSDGKETWKLDLNLPTTLRNLDTVVDVSPDGKRIAVVTPGYFALRIFDIESKSTLATHLLPVVPNGPAVTWHPHGHWVGVTYGEGHDFADVIDATTGRVVAHLEGDHTVGSLSFHPNGMVAAGVGWDNTTRFWNLAHGKAFLTLPFIVGHPNFSRDGRSFGTMRTSPIRLLEYLDAPEYRSLGMGRGTGAGSEQGPAKLSPDGRLLAFQNAFGTHLLELASGRLAATFGNTTRTSLNRNLAPHWSADSRTLDSSVGMFQLARSTKSFDSAPPTIATPRMLWPIPEPLDELLVHPDGRRAILPTGGTYDLETGRVRTFEHRKIYERQHHSHVHPSGTMVATGGWHVPLVTVWNPNDGRVLKTFEFGNGTIPTFTPDGRTLILTRGPSYVFYDVASWEITKTILREAATHPGPVAFSPDGSQIVLEVVPGELTLFRYPSFTPIVSLIAPDRERAGFSGDLQFTPDGAQLIYRVEPNTHGCRLWDLRLIRRRLADFGLDWDAPAYPAATTPTPIPSIRVEPGDASASAARASRAGREQLVLAYAANPFDPGVNRYLAMSVLPGKKQYAEAFGHAEKSLLAEPIQLDLMVFVVDLSMELRRWADAEKWATQILALFPEAAESSAQYYARAVARLNLGRFSEALTDLDEAGRRNLPNSAGLINDARCVALTSVGRTREAAAHFSAANEKPTSQADFRRRAEALIFRFPSPHSDSYALAMSGTAVLKFKSVTDGDQLAYDLALHRTGRNAEAVRRLSQRLLSTTSPTRAESYFVLALCHITQGDYAEAETAARLGQKLWSTKRKSTGLSMKELLRGDALEAEVLGKLHKSEVPPGNKRK